MEPKQDLDSIRWEMTLYFQRNPYARETAEGIALRLGRPSELVCRALERLVEQTFLEKRGSGGTVLYRYRRPYLNAAQTELTRR